MAIADWIHKYPQVQALLQDEGDELLYTPDDTGACGLDEVFGRVSFSIVGRRPLFETRRPLAWPSGAEIEALAAPFHQSDLALLVEGNRG